MASDTPNNIVVAFRRLRYCVHYANGAGAIERSEHDNLINLLNEVERMSQFVFKNLGKTVRLIY